MLRLDYVAGVNPAKWLRVWAELRPELPLDAQRVDEVRQRTALDAGEADLAFIRQAADAAPADTEGLHRVGLWEEAPVVVLAKDHPLADTDAFTIAELEGLDRAPEQGDPAMLLELVAAGTGIAVLPQALARLHARRDIVARPLSDGAPTRIALVWRVERDDTDIQEFVAVVRGRTARSSRGADAAGDAEGASAGTGGSRRSRGSAADGTHGTRSGTSPRGSRNPRAAHRRGRPGSHGRRRS
ncbi:LysR substrate-binding domain-containing protein [Agromyces archimandritae]|uniref:LysR family transcriptional regulator n=1 Tax=Agromyces archimandritae TaxID=2781962 RepID=A0A975FPY1_9MICO|nr:LysR substrate-binding domain-containing protein [Agromyces archimandritae]QTX05533.1 LysR family transcriptional regulator [Agromyces archimandritae]